MESLDTADPFSNACGIAGSLRLSVERLGSGKAEIHELHSPFAIIGRSQAADLTLGDPSVSRRHAYLQVVDGRAFIMDMGSRSGLNWGQDQQGAGWIGAEGVRIGPFLIRVPGAEIEASAMATPSPTSRAFLMPRAVKLTLDLGETSTKEEGLWQVSRVLVLIGRSNACRLKLKGNKISSFHAMLVRTSSGAWLVDMLTPSGTLVNGNPIRAVCLADGDEIEVGPRRMSVRFGRIEPSAAAVEMLPARIEVPTLAKTPGSEMLPVSVLEEFGRMQETMADQFQQALMTMARLFGGMHQEQMGLLREEMAHLRALTDEQQALQNRLAESDNSHDSTLTGPRLARDGRAHV